MALPVIQPKTAIRKSRSTRWRALVLVLVHLAIAAHIAHWLVTGRTVTPVEPSEAAHLARSGVINTGLVFFAVTIVLTAVFGRFFCGWACHLVALQDLSRSLLEKLGRRPAPLRSRLLRWVPAAAFFYAFLWPAVHRWIMGGRYESLETEFTTAEFWATFPSWTIGILTFVICGFVAIYFLGAKGFCTYACPYGAAFAAAERVAPLRIRVTDACEGCGHCTAVCTSNVRVHEEVRDFGMVVDSGCMKCLDCVSVCPNDALYYGAGKLPLFAERRASGPTMARFPLDWAEEAVLAIAFVLAFVTFRGLYGYVPILMALGLSGVLAYLGLLTWQLGRRANVRLKGWQLKRAGRLQRAGVGFLASMTAVLAFWAHSGAVRAAIARGDGATGVLARWQRAAFDLALPRPAPPASDRETLERGIAGYSAAERIGLVSTRGAAAHLAAMHWVLGDDADAAREARRSIERGELEGRMHQLLGRQAFDRGDATAAALHFERAIAADRYDSRPHTSLGIVRARSGDLAAARSTFESARDAFGATADLEYNLALVEAYDGRLAAAAEGFERAVALDPEHLPALENLAGTLAAAGRYEEAAARYAEAVVRAPRDPVTRVLYAQVLAALGRDDLALEQVDAALRLAPGDPDAQRLRSALADSTG